MNLSDASSHISNDFTYAKGLNSLSLSNKPKKQPGAYLLSLFAIYSFYICVFGLDLSMDIIMIIDFIIKFIRLLFLIYKFKDYINNESSGLGSSIVRADIY